jgi:hypothetical protein
MLYRARVNADLAVFKCKMVDKNKIHGYELINTYFVDNSGFGSESESALTANQFLIKVKAGLYYGIQEAGQFQVYIGEYKKISSAEIKRNNPDIISSKKIKNNTRLTVYSNGDKTLTLHSTDIIKWQGNKIILNNGGWDTKTTRQRFNEFLPSGISVYRHKGVTMLDVKGAELEFYNGIEI